MSVRWLPEGKFVDDRGATFIPVGGVYPNWVDVTLMGVAPDEREETQEYLGRRMVVWPNVTEEHLHQWIAHLKAEGCNFVRMFCRGSMNPQDPLDIGGRVNPVLWAKMKRFWDLLYEAGIHVHFVACQEPRCSIYMDSGRVLNNLALPHYTADQLAALPPHRKRFLDPAQPRVGYDSFFTDPDVLQCHLDYLTELASLAAGHPALMILEIYNEQQWPHDGFYWDHQEEELAWSRRIIQHMHRLFPGVPVCMNIAGFGISAHDGAYWKRQVPEMDFFSPHVYQTLPADSFRADYVHQIDAVLNWLTPVVPSMIGEWYAEEFFPIPGVNVGDAEGRDGQDLARRLTRDVIWISLLNNCPGVGLWTGRGWNEFDTARRIMESVDFARFQARQPVLQVDVRRHDQVFREIELHPRTECGLPSDIWCPHRHSDQKHRYCWKASSREMQELFHFARAAMVRGVSYRFTRQPDAGQPAKIWQPDWVKTEELEALYRPFAPVNRCVQVKYLSSADERTHIVYLRNGEPIKVGRFTSRRPGRPHPVHLRIDLPGDTYELRIHDLDTGQAITRTQPAQGPLDLGRTSHDFVLVWRRS